MSSTKKHKPVCIRQQVLIQKVQKFVELSAHRWIFSLRNYEKQPPPTRLTVGTVCWPPYVMFTLWLWVTECVLWVSTAKICRSHSVEQRSHVAALHTATWGELVKDTHCVMGKDSQSGEVRCHLLDALGCCIEGVESSVQHYAFHNQVPAIVGNPLWCWMMIYKCNTGIFSVRIANTNVSLFP
jgi:hypothetical protein